MNDEKNPQNRATLLADVAEMYYLDEKDQSAIAREIGVTRSMVSRMLTEARSRGIIEIKINRPFQTDRDLEERIKQCFGIDTVFVIPLSELKQARVTAELGRAAAIVIKNYLKPNTILGLAWGTTVSAAADAMEPIGSMPVKVVQLVGAMGAKNAEYDGHAVVQRMASKLGGEAYFINAPYLCQSAEIAQSMIETKGIKESIELGRQVDVALLGVGTIETRYSSYYLAGLLVEEEIDDIRKMGVVGDIASNFFTLDGNSFQNDFTRRLIAIALDDLARIPTRIGVAGGPGKTNAIIGALKSKLINVLITDSITAAKILEQPA